MKKLLFLICIFCALKANAQNYLITFAGTGASTSVASVKVENLTKSTSLTLNGSDFLHLTTIITGVNSIQGNQSSELKIYPNPMNDNSTMEIYPPVAGNAIITLCDITGRPIAQIQSYLEYFKQVFRLSGINNGFYLINVKGNGYQFSGKLLSNSKSGGTISIEKVNSTVQIADKKVEKLDSKGTQGTVDMEYSNGDRLKFTGISGIYSTVMIDVPISSKTITFNFIGCTDSDNNNYPVVEIGNQVWMAENLKTTKLDDGTDIPNVTSPRTLYYLTSPAYLYVNNNPVYKNIYGCLYNWYTVKTDKLCPQGWHVPSEDDWMTLISHLGGESIAGDKLKETGITHWGNLNTGATNESGFTALPGGKSNIDLWTPTYIGFMSFGEGSQGDWWSSTEMSTYIWDAVYLQVYNNSNISDLSVNKKQGLSVRCLKDEILGLPVIITTEAVSITQTSASSGGSITNDGGAPVTDRGVCWSSSPDPTIAYSKTTDGMRTGVFTSSITGLRAGTTYYVRAYATNSLGTVYGNQIKFNTKIADTEENTYSTVSIGTQVWMAENLKTTKYNDGTNIPLVSDNAEWGTLVTPGYCWFDNNAVAYKNQYGALYNWYAINTGKLCPSGWHVATDNEWITLTTYLGGESVAGGKLKEAGTLHWLNPNSGATNQSGFTALPGGDRNSAGAYSSIGFDGTWWSSSENNLNNAWYRSMNYNVNNVNRNYYSKENGFSVRCIKEEVLELPTITTTAISGLTQTTAASGGVVTNDGGITITGRGVCWNTSVNPTISNNKTSNGVGPGDFTSAITGLTSGITYYVRAYATNSIGTAYGNEIIFATKGETGTVSDIDGNTYSTIVIGSQTWMSENLKTTKNNDGTSIPFLLDDSTWHTQQPPSAGYCWYNIDELVYKSTYGALYNLYAVDAMRISGKNICPIGWHVPTDTEWTILTDYLTNNGYGYGGSGSNIAKSMAATTVWTTFSNPGTIGNDLASNNSSGFNAMPGGWRGNNGSGYLPTVRFSSINYTGSWWTSTIGPSIQLNFDRQTDCAWKRSLTINYSDVGRNSGYGRDCNSVRCLKGDIPLLPVITTSAAVSLTQNTVTSGGNVTSDGGATITGRGVCWSTLPDPTIEKNKTSDGTGTGEFTSSLTGLKAGETYYIRAYATNIVGTNYGNQIIVTTKIADVEGNNYNIVTIGSQVWMAENLKTTKYNDSNPIPLITEATVWPTLMTPGYCWYNNDPVTYKAAYGALYNWYAVHSKILCPSGWHVPTDTEWTSMTTYLGDESVAGGKLKEAGTIHWISPNTGATNESGFTDLPGGVRYANGLFDFLHSTGSRGYWWNTDEWDINQAWGKNILTNYSSVFSSLSDKKNGYSVRCIKNN